MGQSRPIALMEAFFVTFLWSSSYILIKIGLTQLSPLILVSLRYIIASVILISLTVPRGEEKHIKDKKTFLKLFFLGFLGYTLAQGLQCVGLVYLPAVSVSFILNFTPIIVLILGMIFLQEYPTFFQLMGMIIVLIGAYLFFSDHLVNSSLTGVLIALLSGLGWGAYLVLSKLLFIKNTVKPLELTAFPMGFGTLLMVLGAVTFEEVPVVSPLGWGILIWLGVINTALAFFMWNHALQILKAFEISILQNTMLAQIALLSYVFLGESLTLMKISAMVLVFIGVLIVQLKRSH